MIDKKFTKKFETKAQTNTPTSCNRKIVIADSAVLMTDGPWALLILTPLVPILLILPWGVTKLRRRTGRQCGRTYELAAGATVTTAETESVVGGRMGFVTNSSEMVTRARVRLGFSEAEERVGGGAEATEGGRNATGVAGLRRLAGGHPPPPVHPYV